MSKAFTRSIFCFAILALMAVTASLTMMVTYADDDFYTVRIEYLFKDSSKAHDAYVAVVPKGTDVDIAVTNPIIPGYKPVESLEDDAAAAYSTRLDFAVHEDVNLTVWYVPDLVHYKVRYFMQNIRDDLYTENLGLDNSYYERTGLTGQYPKDLEKMNFEGFTALFHEPDFIAADGSTVFKLYFERNYYLVDFNLDGGYGTEPVYEKYGSTFTVAEPKRMGYVFKGWALTDSDGNFIDESGKRITEEQAKQTAQKFTNGVIPAQDLHYKAIWEAEYADYSIVYLFESTDETGLYNETNGRYYTVIGATDMKHVRKSGELADATDSFYEGVRTSHDKAIADLSAKFGDMSDDQKEQLWNPNRFTFDSSLSSKQVMVNGDNTTRVYAYYNRKEYTQRFFYMRENMDPTIPADQRFEVPGYTKAFSKGNFSTLSADEELRKHLVCNNGTGVSDWRAIIAEKVQIRSEYKDKIQEKIYPAAGEEYIQDIRYRNNNKTNNQLYPYRYYYFEVKTKYYSNMSRNGDWLIDAFEPVPLNDGSGMVAKFGAWSVEQPAKYASGIDNRTVKGIYEELDEELMRRYDNGTTLNYLSFWTNVKNKDWNGLGSTKGLYQFNYHNFVPVLPGEESDDDYIRDGVHYTLHSDEIVISYDGGSSYGSDSVVKEQQTATEIEGFHKPAANKNETRIEIHRPKDADGQPLKIDGYTVVDVYYFYIRCGYSLKFRNSNEKENDHTQSGILYGQSISEFNHTPEYHIPELAKYYRFEGWYRSPLYKVKVDFNTMKMPADDMTLYAKWVPVQEKVTFYNDYVKFYRNEDYIHTCMVDYNEFLLSADVPDTNQSSALHVTPPTPNARFSGWYYLNENNVPVRFEPEAFPITRELKLYAAWESSDRARYKVTYTEKGTGTEVAPPMYGTAFVSKTKSFKAKTSGELNDEHVWKDGEKNWWPVISSHSILVEPNEAGEEFAPNEYNFEYIKKADVWYRVRYINTTTGEDIIPEKTVNTSNAVVTESSEYISGFIANRVTDSMILSASAKENAEEAKAEELSMNTLVFFYTINDNEALYQVDHYIENLYSTDPTDTSNYSLYLNETMVGELNASLDIESVYHDAVATSLTKRGYNIQPDMTTVNGEPAQTTVVTDGSKIIISVYYRRNDYNYKVIYVDYEQEKLHDEDPGEWDGVLCTNTYSGKNARPVGDVVSIEPESQYIYRTGAKRSDEGEITYTRISDRQLSLTIHPDTEDPKTNVIKVYYRKDSQRVLSYKLVCLPNEVEDEYATLSRSQQIAESQDDINKNPVVIYKNNSLPRDYTFLGWYDNPKGEGSPLSIPDHDGEGDPYQNPAKEFTPLFPPSDMTYYAVFRQEQVFMNAEIMYNDTGVYDETAKLDADGSVTGASFRFIDPHNYVIGSDTPLDREDNFEFAVIHDSSHAYRYCFAGWYELHPDGEVIPRYDIDQSTGEYIKLAKTQSWHYIAMFKKVESVPYKIVYSFTTRTNGDQSYVVKGEFKSAAEIAANTDESTVDLRLSDSFIVGRAPFESNHGETFCWSDTNIVKTCENGVITAYVSSVQAQKKVTVSYRLAADGPFKSFRTDLGANRGTDERMEVLDMRGNGEFSYWAIRKSEKDSDPIIAKCTDPWFSYCIMDDYWITPVFGDDSKSDTPEITLTHLEYTRNRWTDEEGNLYANGSTDLLYSDFEIAFSDGAAKMFEEESGYKTGVVFELCGKMDGEFEQGRDYGYESDPDKLKEAVTGNKSWYYCDGAAQKRNIQISNIPTEKLTNKNRIEFGKAYKNAYKENGGEKVYTNSTYLMKVTAFFTDKDNNVTLSNSVYICLSDIAAKNLAMSDMWVH